jgi:hypothetical protein
MKNRRRSKLPEWTNRLNGSQRACLTKFTRTGERDMTNRVSAERPMRTALWEKRKNEAKQKEAA